MCIIDNDDDDDDDDGTKAKSETRPNVFSFDGVDPNACKAIFGRIVMYIGEVEGF